MRALSTFSEFSEREQAHKIYGIVIGIVVKNDDPEGWHRVKVTIPTLKTKDDYTTDWCRVLSPMAGLTDHKGENPQENKRGLYFLPEKGDEVAVMFENGDIACPIVVGSFWNAKDAPPYTPKDDKENDRRGIYSRLGHRLEFVDKKGQGQVILRSKSDGKQFATIIIDDEKKTIEILGHNNKNFVKIDSDKDEITVNSAKNINMLAEQDIKIVAKGKISTESTSDTKMLSKAKFEVQSSSNMTLNSSAAADLKASSTCTIRGAQVNIN